MRTADDNAETTGAEEARPSLIRRILAIPARTYRTARNRPLLTAVLLCGSAIIVASGVSIGYYLLTRSPWSDRYVTIQAALALLDEGKYDEARQMALRLSRKHRDDLRQQGHPLFIQGAALYLQAAQLGHGEEYQTICLLAARYLQEAQSRGFPPGRETEGLYLLGKCLFDAQQYAESLPALHDTLERMPKQKYDTARRLSTAYLRDTSPNFKQALHYNQLWLQDPALRGTASDEALVQLAEIYLALHKNHQSREVLQRLDEDSPVHARALLLQARLAIQEGDDLIANLGEASAATSEAKDRYREAIGHLERGKSKSEVAAQQSQYLLGVCHQKLGDLRAATEAYKRTRQKYYRTPEALAATLAEAEIAQQQGKDDTALGLYLKLLEEGGDAEHYRNRWVGLAELRDRLTVAQQQFLMKHEYDMSLKMAAAFSSILPTDSVACAKAETYEIWGEQLLAEADTSSNTAAELKRAEARVQFRLAGTHYRQLAELRFATSEYPDDLWKSGYCYLRGQNYRLAIKVLQEHLNNTPRKQAALGLVGLGESHLALGEYRTALTVLNNCIELFPKHPESYRARLLASHALRELGNLPAAESLLIDNLHRSSLTPRSRYWQESLVAYGKLLFQRARGLELQANKEMAEARKNEVVSSQRNPGLTTLKQANDLYQKAIGTLEESVQREERTALQEGREPDSYEAEYYIAEAYRHSANLPKESLAGERTQTRRITLRQQMRAYLQSAAQTHHDLQAQLARKQNETELSPLEKRVLRNTYFAYADALFSLEEFDQAINAYVAAANRYQHQPEALEALMQIANCYRRLGATAEARGTLVQAKSVFERIPKDADFSQTTRYNRTQWEQLIGWLARL